MGRLGIYLNFEISILLPVRIFKGEKSIIFKPKQSPFIQNFEDFKFLIKFWRYMIFLNLYFFNAIHFQSIFVEC